MAYNPNQPRVPAGNPDGGQWTSAGGGSSVAAARAAAGLPAEETINLYRNPDGSWDPARQQLHDDIIAQHFEGKTPVDNPVGYMLGGGTAAGKSTALRAGNMVIPENTVKVDSDKIKFMLPEMQQLLDEGNPAAAAVVHEESSYLSKLIAAKAGEGGYNVLLDGTGNSSLTKLTGKVNSLRASGQTVEAFYVTVDTQTAIQRAVSRAQRTGRMVPISVIEWNHKAVSRTFPLAVEAGLFDKFQLWDNNGSSPVLIAEGYGSQITVYDWGLYNAFLDKGK